VLGMADDVAALWEHLPETVDCIATDHAPHTITEKLSVQPPPGVPGLETSLALMLTAVAEGRLTLEQVVTLMHDNPRRIFGLPEQPDTHIEVDMDTPFVVHNEKMHSRCGWTPFAGQELVGQVQTVVLRGQKVYENGEVLARHGRVFPAYGQ
ncbi:MAG: hypothetical protein KDD89_13085, partial [Anaerolineales bacterium]|nr:hypothetical protein [Anaerolineales bacterium]